jgi:hypothetical protein
MAGAGQDVSESDGTGALHTADRGRSRTHNRAVTVKLGSGPEPGPDSEPYDPRVPLSRPCRHSPHPSASARTLAPEGHARPA